MADLPTKKGSELPLSSSISSSDTIFGIRQGVTSRFAAAAMIDLTQTTYQASAYGFGAAGADNSARLADAAADVSAKGGGLLELPYGTFTMASGVSYPANVLVRGKGKKATTLAFVGTETMVAIDLTKPPGNYNEGGIENLTISNSGATGVAAVRTPEDADQFINNQKYRFSGLGFQGNSWRRYLSLGDCSQCLADFFEIRGRYIPSATDVGQEDCVAVYLSGLRGVVRANFTNFASIGTRRGVVLGEFVEGVVFDGGEITNCWEGITSTTVASKPGGFVDNMHISANKRCVGLQARRDLQIGTIQCYRSTGMFAHGTGWKGVEFLGSSQRITISSLELRNTVTDAGEQVGITVAGGSKLTVTQTTVAEDSYLTHLIDVFGTASLVSTPNVTLGTVPTGIRLAGNVTNCDFGNWLCDSLPSTPVSMNGSGVSRSTVQLPRFSCVPRYTEASYTTAQVINIVSGQTPANLKASITAAVAVDHQLENVIARQGDVFNIRITITQVLATYRVLSPTGTALVTVAGNTSANTLRNIRLIHNGAGWVVDDVHTPLQ